MGDMIKLRRGLKADLPVLQDGEFGYATDTQQAYIGNDGVNDLLFAKDAKIYEVGADQAFTTVQAAIDQAETDGHTSNDNAAFILIRPGSYTENLTLKPGIHLIGKGSEVGNGPSVAGVGAEIIIIGTHTYSVSNANSRGQNRLILRGLALSTVNGVTLTFAGTGNAEILTFECIIQKQTGGDVNPAYRITNTNGGARARFNDTYFSHDVATSTVLDLQRGATDFRGRLGGVFSGNGVTLNAFAVLTNSASLNIGPCSGVTSGPFTQIFDIQSTTASVNVFASQITNSLTGGHLVKFTANGSARFRNSTILLQDQTARIATGTGGNLNFSNCMQNRNGSANNNSADNSVNVFQEGIFGTRKYSNGAVQIVNVGGFNGYPTIQLAINDIENSTLNSYRWLVMIQPGNYNESVTITNSSGKFITLMAASSEQGKGGFVAPVSINGKFTDNSNGGTTKLVNIRLNQTGADNTLVLNPTSFHFFILENSTIEKSGADTGAIVKNDTVGSSILVLNKSPIVSLNAVRRYVENGSTGNTTLGYTPEDLYYVEGNESFYPVNLNATNSDSINAFPSIQIAVEEALNNGISNKTIVLHTGTYTENVTIDGGGAGVNISLVAKAIDNVETNHLVVIEGLLTLTNSTGGFLITDGIKMQQTVNNASIILNECPSMSMYFNNTALFSNTNSATAPLIDNDLESGCPVFFTNCRIACHHDGLIVATGATGNTVRGFTPKDMFYTEGTTMFYTVDSSSGGDLYRNAFPTIQKAINQQDELAHSGPTIFRMVDGAYTEDLNIIGNSTISLIASSHQEGEQVNNINTVVVIGSATINMTGGAFKAKGIKFEQTQNIDVPTFDIQSQTQCYFDSCSISRGGTELAPIISNVTVASGANIFLTNTNLGSFGNLDRRFITVGGTTNVVTGTTPNDMYRDEGSARYYRVDTAASSDFRYNAYPKIGVALEEALEHGGNTKVIELADSQYVEADLNFTGAHDFYMTAKNVGVQSSDRFVSVQGKVTVGINFGRIRFRGINFVQPGNDNLFLMEPATNCTVYFEDCVLSKTGTDGTSVISNIGTNSCTLDFRRTQVSSSGEPTARAMIEQHLPNTGGINAFDSGFNVGGAGLQLNHRILDSGAGAGVFSRCTFGAFSEYMFNLVDDGSFLVFNQCNFNVAYERGQIFYFDGPNSQVQITHSNVLASNNMVGALVARKGTQATASISVNDNNFDTGDAVIVNGVNFTLGTEWSAGVDTDATAVNIATAINSSVHVNVNGKIYAVPFGNIVNLFSVVWSADANAYTLSETDNATDNFGLSGATFVDGADGPANTSFSFGHINLNFPNIQDDISIGEFTKTLTSVSA